MNVRRGLAILVLSLCGLFLLFVLLSPFVGGWLMQRAMQQTYAVVSKVVLPCDTGASQELEGWSKAGYSVSCRVKGEKNGPWQAWEGGHLAISGQYANGKQAGTWLVYLPNGKVYRTITYLAGVEVTNVVSSQ